MPARPAVVETSVVRRSRDVFVSINQYALLDVLGEGMHGKVLLARNAHTGETVAIKSMRRKDPRDRRLPRSTHPTPAPHGAVSKIHKEIAIMKKCSHQNLVQLREVIDDPTSRKVYLVMENLAGGEVLWRTKDGPVAPVLTLDQVQRIMRDVTLGLEYLHHQGIIHRDIKPANLLWTADRQSVKICDFGVSQFSYVVAKDGIRYDEAGLSRTAGSPAFFAPEICSSSSENIRPRVITKSIDIWALGVTFYCLLFGTPPWQGLTEFIMFRRICDDPFPIPDTMVSERIPTGGRDRLPEGRGIGWTIVDLLTGLLQKSQDDRISLAEIKRIPWIHAGVDDPERWLRETAPDAQTLVTVTDQDTRDAIRIVWVQEFTRRLRKSLVFARARSRSVARSMHENAVAGPSTAPPNGASPARKRSVVDRFKRGPSKEQRRAPEQTHSDPASTSTSLAAPARPAHDAPAAPRSFFFGGAPAAPDEGTAPSPTGFRSRLSEMLRRPRSAKAKNKARSLESAGGGGGGGGAGESSGGAEDDSPRSSGEARGAGVERARLHAGQRAASWAAGACADDDDDDDGASSATDPGVKVFGAGGYAARPACARDAESASSSDSTPTPQPHDAAAARGQGRVTSPLARARFHDGGEDAAALSSDVFDEPDDDGDDSSDEDVLELRTRRPSTVLSRSGNASPRR